MCHLPRTSPLSHPVFSYIAWMNRDERALNLELDAANLARDTAIANLEQFQRSVTVRGSANEDREQLLQQYQEEVAIYSDAATSCEQDIERIVRIINDEHLAANPLPMLGPVCFTPIWLVL